MKGKLFGGLLVGHLLIISGCTSTVSYDSLTLGGQTPILGVSDPATQDHPDDESKIRLESWPQYAAFPHQITTDADWRLLFVICCESRPPQLSRDWRDVAYFLAQRSTRTRLQRLLAYSYDAKLPYFLSLGDKLNSTFVKMAVFEETSDGGLMRQNRALYRQAHYPNIWASMIKGIGLGETDPTLEAFQNLPMQWLPSVTIAAGNANLVSR